MNIHYGQALVVHGNGDHAKIDGIVDDRFHDFCPLQAADLDPHVGIEFFKFGKDFRQDVQAGAFIGPDHDFAARDTLHFRQGNQHGFAGVQGLLCVLLEVLACRGERYLATAAVEQPGANLFFKRANLG